MKVFFSLSLFFILALLQGCSHKEIIIHGDAFSDLNHSAQQESIAVFAFDNFTQTPQAGKRAASMTGGILRGRGISVINCIEETETQTRSRFTTAQEANATYLLIGAVNEWRYKTGIDGEPAVSLTLQLTEVHSGKTVWSATGSSNGWGNRSIGTTAQELVTTLLH